MTSQKLCEHVGRIASCTNREAYEWRGFSALQMCCIPDSITKFLKAKFDYFKA